VASLLDEALGRASILTDNPAWTMTGKLEVRYRRYVPYGPLLRVRATLESTRRKTIQASGFITLAEDETNMLAEASGLFFPLPPGAVDAIAQDFPHLRHLLEQRLER
jgi:hypothetical protein